MASESYAYKHFNVTFPKEYVVHVETNRPEKMNAFIEGMWLELCELTDRLSHDPAVRAIIFSGAGDRAFTAGLDVNAASSSTDGGLISSVQDSSIDSARKAVHLRRKVVSFQDCVSALERCEKPVIAAMHGITFGLGIDLSVATDIRLCAQGTKFSVKEVDIGIAADIGTLTRLPKVVGHYGWVKEVCLTGRIFGPEEALRVGFVNAVYDDKAKMIAAAVEMAALIASKSPVAVQGTKELLNYSRDHAVEDGLKYTAVWSASMMQTKDLPAAVMSGMTKRTPTFEKL